MFYWPAPRACYTVKNLPVEKPAARERIQKIEKRPAFILNDRVKKELLSEKEVAFAERLVEIEVEHLQSEVMNKVERWSNEGLGAKTMAKWGKHYPENKYVCVRFLFIDLSLLFNSNNNYF